jgi:hypothetical protein
MARPAYSIPPDPDDGLPITAGISRRSQADAQLGSGTLKDVSSADTAVETLGSGSGLSLTGGERAWLPRPSSRSKHGPLARDVEGGAVLVDSGGCVVPPFRRAPLGPGSQPVDEPLRRVGAEQRLARAEVPLKFPTDGVALTIEGGTIAQDLLGLVE